MTKTPFGLSWLVNPIRSDVFIKDYWERSPLLIKRKDRSYFAGIMDIRDVEELLPGSETRDDFVRCVKDGSPISLGAGTGVEKSLAAFRSGATIVLQGLHRARPTLSALTNALAREFSCNFQINAYLTPSSEKTNRGLGLHYDTHDVFVLQLAGIKRWRIYQSPLRLPLPTQPHDPSARDRGKCLIQCDLHPGDCLYIPRGFYHSAKVTRSLRASLHLTIGIHPVKWADLITSVLQKAMEQEAPLRESLPFAFAKNSSTSQLIRRRFLHGMDTLAKPRYFEAALRAITERLVDQQYPVLDRHFEDLDACADLRLDTKIKRRPGIAAEAEVKRNELTLRFHGKVVEMPSHLAGALRFMRRVPVFSARQLPGDFSRAEKLVLIRRLIEEGYLTFAR